MTILEKLLDALVRLINKYLAKKRQAVRFEFTITQNGEDHLNMEKITLHVDEKVVVTIDSPVDAKGRPAKIEGQPEWNVTGAAVQLFPSSDGMSCEVAGINPTADGEIAQVTISGDADLGPGVKTITSMIEVTVLPVEAVGFSVKIGPVQPV